MSHKALFPVYSHIRDRGSVRIKESLLTITLPSTSLKYFLKWTYMRNFLKYFFQIRPYIVTLLY